MAALSTIALLTAATLTTAKTAVTFSEQRKAAKAAEEQGDFEAMLFGRNAEAAERQAADAIARGEEGVSDSQKAAGLLTGSQRAGFATQGVQLDSGSAADVVANDAMLAEIDQSRIRLNAARAAAGYQSEADSYRMQGDWARKVGKRQAKSLRNQSISTLLSGAGELAMSFAKAPRFSGSRSASRSGFTPGTVSSVGYGPSGYNSGIFGRG